MERDRTRYGKKRTVAKQKQTAGRERTEGYRRPSENPARERQTDRRRIEEGRRTVAQRDGNPSRRSQQERQRSQQERQRSQQEQSRVLRRARASSVRERKEQAMQHGRAEREQHRRVNTARKAAGRKPIASGRQRWMNRLDERRMERRLEAAAGRGERRKSRVFERFMSVKLAMLYFIILLAFACLGIRLMYINYKDGENYKKQILSQQEYSSKSLPYKRGEILDANGTKLAYSEKVYNLVIDAYEINHSNEENAKDVTLKALAEFFKMNTTEISQYITENENSRYFVAKKMLTYDEIAPFQEAKKANNQIVGIWFEEEYRRQYPCNLTASKLVGFIGSDNNGTGGLEEYYNDLLNGTNGRQYGYLTEDSTLERTTIPARDGETLVTSIDVNIQNVVEKHINAFSEEHANEYRQGERGAANIGVIVMDPQTGNILAMADDKQYDLNNPKDLSAYYSQEEIAGLSDEETYDRLNRIWRNYCISDTYEPGSVAKSMTIAAGLDSGKMTGQETYVCNAVLEVSGHPIKCHKRIGHGTVTVSEALEQSCNVALMHMGSQMGKETLMKYLYSFNLGLKTNIDLAGEARTNTLVYNVDDMVASDLAVSTFGQGYNVTMIQMASAFCSIINGGKYYEPHVVTEIKNADGTTAKKVEPRVLKQTISVTTSDKLREYLKNVCVKGTGTTAVPAGYVIGGKTGTAERQPRGNKQYVVSFMGFAPVEDPKVVVYCVIDRPNVEDQPHSTFAQEVVRNIMTELLPYMNIFRTEELTEEQKAELEDMSIISQEGDEGEPSEGDASGEDGQSEGEGEAEGQEGEAGEDDGPGYQIDPESGNAIDPNSGEQLDPNTFEPIDPGSSDLGGVEGIRNDTPEGDDDDVSYDFSIGAWF